MVSSSKLFFLLHEAHITRTSPVILVTTGFNLTLPIFLDQYNRFHLFLTPSISEVVEHNNLSCSLSSTSSIFPSMFFSSRQYIYSMGPNLVVFLFFITFSSFLSFPVLLNTSLFLTLLP